MPSLPSYISPSAYKMSIFESVEWESEDGKAWKPFDFKRVYFKSAYGIQFKVWSEKTNTLYNGSYKPSNDTIRLTYKNEKWSGNVYIRAVQGPVIQWSWETANKKKIGSVWKAKNWSTLRTSKFIQVALRALAVAAIVAGGMRMQRKFDKKDYELREELHMEGVKHTYDVGVKKKVLDHISERNLNLLENDEQRDTYSSHISQMEKEHQEEADTALASYKNAREEKARGSGTSVVTTFQNFIKTFTPTTQQQQNHHHQ